MFISNNFKFCYLWIWKYHPQTFLEECKYIKENINSKNYTDMELELEYDSDIDSDRDNGIYIDIDNEE